LIGGAANTLDIPCPQTPVRLNVTHHQPTNQPTHPRSTRVIRVNSHFQSGTPKVTCPTIRNKLTCAKALFYQLFFTFSANLPYATTPSSGSRTLSGSPNVTVCVCVCVCVFLRRVPVRVRE